MSETRTMLSSIKIDQNARICKLYLNDKEKRRLGDLGIFCGSSIKKILISPLGDPSAYLVKGSVIALRTKDAEKISVITQ